MTESATRVRTAFISIYPFAMADRIEKKEFVRRVAARMRTDEIKAAAWVDGVLDEMYATFESRYGLTLPGFGGFYLERRGGGIAFRFNPGQRFGWSSTYRG